MNEVVEMLLDSLRDQLLKFPLSFGGWSEHAIQSDGGGQQFGKLRILRDEALSILDGGDDARKQISMRISVVPAAITICKRQAVTSARDR